MAGQLPVWTFPVLLAVGTLSASGGLSRSTPCPQPISPSILAHMVGTLVTFAACTPGSAGPQFLPCWFGAPLPGWQRHPPVGPDVGGHVSGLGGPYVPSPFSLNGLLGGTSPEELGMMQAPCLPMWVPI